MKEAKIFNVTDKRVLPSMAIEKYPEEGEPLEIEKEVYYVCKKDYGKKGEGITIDVIPLVVRNPGKVENIKSYLDCLSVAHRRVLFRKENKVCDFDECDEMIIS
jgi:hypothetical protein